MTSVLAAMLVAGELVAVEAAATDPVTQADLQMLLERLAKLEAENKSQAARIAELESALGTKTKEATTESASARVYETADGRRYFLADAAANIFEPLSESGLRLTPYGYLIVEGVYNTRGVDVDVYADNVKNPHTRGYRNHTACLSVQDSILGLKYATPELTHGWTFSGKAEFDLAGDHANDYVFHWRHLYVDAAHESGWSILFGQTWHLWKMVAPVEFDGAWMENTGYPYRRSPQLRVTRTWDFETSALEARVGLVKNGPGMGGDRDRDDIPDNSASAWPLIEGALVFTSNLPWETNGRRGLLGLGGQYGQDRLRNYLGNDRKDDYDSMMLMLAAEIPFGRFSLVGHLFAGENLGGVQAGVGQTVAFNPETGRGREVRTIGGFLELGYELDDNWSAALGYGFDNPHLARHYYAVGKDGSFNDNITFNDRAYLDVFYRITTNFRLALEYARLNTRYESSTAVGGHRGGNGYSDRIQFAVFYDF